MREWKSRNFSEKNVREITRSTEFVVRTDTEEIRAATLVVATGGLSIPKMGVTGFCYGLACQLDIPIVDPWPALVPLVFAQKERAEYCELAGISAEVIASVKNGTLPAPSFREDMLITHRGLSGPAILQISSYLRAGQPIEIDLAPCRDVTTPMRDGKVRSIGAPS